MTIKCNVSIVSQLSEVRTGWIKETVQRVARCTKHNVVECSVTHFGKQSSSRAEGRGGKKCRALPMWANARKLSTVNPGQ